MPMLHDSRVQAIIFQSVLMSTDKIIVPLEKEGKKTESKRSEKKKNCKPIQERKQREALNTARQKLNY